MYGVSGNSIYGKPIGKLLLGDSASASTVAKRIETAFDRATLMAWSRSPSAVVRMVYRTEVTRIYVYDGRTLLMLLVPLLATLLTVAANGRWKIGGKEDVLGYDPLAIASRGPVWGLPESFVFLSAADNEKLIVGTEPCISCENKDLKRGFAVA